MAAKLNIFDAFLIFIVFIFIYLHSSLVFFFLVLLAQRPCKAFAQTEGSM